MKPARIATSLLEGLPLLWAAAWPLGAYGQFPGTALSLRAAAGAALCLAAFIAARNDRSCRPAFEYWWIALVVLPAAAAAGFGGAPDQALRWLAGLTLFLSVTAIVRSRRLAADVLLVYALACAVGAFLNGLAQAGLIPPSGIDGEIQVAVAVAGTVPDALALLGTGALAAVFTLIRPGVGPWRRAAAGGALLAIAAWGASLLPHGAILLGRWAPVNPHDLTRPEWAILLSLLWGVARVMARSLLQARSAATALLPVLAGVGILGHVLAAHAPSAGSLVLLGLVAAHDAPWAEPGDAPTRIYRWPAVVALCLLAQVLGIAPLRAQDPRNQVSRASRLLAQERWADVDAQMSFLLARHPGAPEYALIRAQSMLAQGYPAAAVGQFCEAAYSETAPASTLARTQTFLDDLRDLASARDGASRGLLFERALVHSGQVDSALDSLDFRLVPAPPAYTGDREPLALALAQLLGDPRLVPQLDRWNGAQLHALLAESGVGVEKAPDGSIAGLPFIAVAVRRPDGLEVDLALGDGPWARNVIPDTGGVEDGNGGALAWQAREVQPDGLWPVALFAGPEEVASISVWLGDTGKTSVERGAGHLPDGESVAATIYVP